MKNFLNFCKENIELDPFKEEDWNEIQKGDYVTLIKLPENRLSWVHKSKTKVFIIQDGNKKYIHDKEYYEVVLPIEDRVKDYEHIPYKAYIEADCLRLATPEEIEKEYGIKEAVRWYKNGKLEKIPDELPDNIKDDKDLIIIKAYGSYYLVIFNEDLKQLYLSLDSDHQMRSLNLTLYENYELKKFHCSVPFLVPDTNMVTYSDARRGLVTLQINRIPDNIKNRIINI